LAGSTIAFDCIHTSRIAFLISSLLIKCLNHIATPGQCTVAIALISVDRVTVDEVAVVTFFAFVEITITTTTYVDAFKPIILGWRANLHRFAT